MWHYIPSGEGNFIYWKFLTNLKWRCWGSRVVIQVKSSNTPLLMVYLSPAMKMPMRYPIVHNLYSSSNRPTIKIKSKRMGWATDVSCNGQNRNGYRVLVWNPEGKRPLGRHRRRCNDNIKMDLIHLAQGGDQWRTFVNTAMKLRVP
jgi:hypothetical protein